MSGRTTLVRRAVARAGTRGLAHLAHQADTGTWIAMCGRQVRGHAITAAEGSAAVDAATAAGFCPACRDLALTVADDLASGVALLLRLATPDGGTRLLELEPAQVATAPEARRADDALRASVAAAGVVVPLVVRPAGDGFELVAGARRLDAAHAAGLPTVPAVVRDLDDDGVLLERLLENMHRTDLDPIAQAQAYRDALELLGCTRTVLAERLGLSRPTVANTLRLLELGDTARAHVAAGRLTARHGVALLAITDPAEQAAAADRAASDGATSEQVRQGARAATPTRPAALGAVAAALQAALAAQVRVTATADTARVVLSVPVDELAALVARLGIKGLEVAA